MNKEEYQNIGQTAVYVATGKEIKRINRWCKIHEFRPSKSIAYHGYRYAYSERGKDIEAEARSFLNPYNYSLLLADKSQVRKDKDN